MAFRHWTKSTARRIEAHTHQSHVNLYRTVFARKGSPLAWRSHAPPIRACWNDCCSTGAAGAASTGWPDPPPPKSMLLSPCPTVEPTATPAAVEAIYCGDRKGEARAGRVSQESRFSDLTSGPPPLIDAPDQRDRDPATGRQQRQGRAPGDAAHVREAVRPCPNAVSLCQQRSRLEEGVSSLD